METVIAMDGPSGSGKSTMAKKLALSLGVLYIDTGAMFRAIACFIQEQGLELDDSEAIAALIPTFKMSYGVSDDALIVINNINYTQKIREHIVSKWASIVSQQAPVRNFLLNFQRDLVKNQVCVMEGRDIGSVVFPQAFCKVFVTASPLVRASRRFAQLNSLGEEGHSLEKVLADVVKRDKKDTQREVAPLKVADGAIVVDTSELDEERVLSELVEVVRLKAQEHTISLS
jgi:cytidylate kinase